MDNERREAIKKRRDRNKDREYDEDTYKELKEEWGREYLPGSLCELEKIAKRFEESSSNITLYFLTDKFEPFIPDFGGAFYRDDPNFNIDKQELIFSDEEKYGLAFNATTNDAVFINEEHREELEPFYIPFKKFVGTRKFRRLSSFLEAMGRIILCKVDDDRDFISRYFFQQMKWNRRDIERIYFNTKSRKIYFHLNPHEQVE